MLRKVYDHLEQAEYYSNQLIILFSSLNSISYPIVVVCRRFLNRSFSSEYVRILFGRLLSFCSEKGRAFGCCCCRFSEGNNHDVDSCRRKLST